MDAATEVLLREKMPVVRHFERLGRAYRINANAGADEVERQVLPLLGGL